MARISMIWDLWTRQYACGFEQYSSKNFIFKSGPANWRDRSKSLLKPRTQSVLYLELLRYSIKLVRSNNLSPKYSHLPKTPLYDSLTPIQALSDIPRTISVLGMETKNLTKEVWLVGIFNSSRSV